MYKFYYHYKRSTLYMMFSTLLSDAGGPLYNGEIEVKYAYFKICILALALERLL